MRRKKSEARDDGWRIPDGLWKRIRRLLPPPHPHPLGCHNPPTDQRKVMDAVFFVLRTGARWSSLPAFGFMPGSTAHRWFQRWSRAGVFRELRKTMPKKYVKSIDWFRVFPDDHAAESAYCGGGDADPKPTAPEARTESAGKRRGGIRGRGDSRTAGGGILPVNDFAMLARTTRDTLSHYARIGILPAASRRNNKYRYYSSGQLGTMNVIRVLQAGGMTLPEIKAVMDNRTPERMYDLFGHQIGNLDAEMLEWIRRRKLLLAMRETIHSALDIDEGVITAQSLPETPIVLGGMNDYGQGGTDYDALLNFYGSVGKKYPDLDLNYPVWGVISGDRVKQGDWTWPDRYYLGNPEGQDKRPAALYAVGYARGGYGRNRAVYGRLVDYIAKNGLEICGDAYEEYPLNEISVSDDSNYLMRVMITVREKKMA